MEGQSIVGPPLVWQTLPVGNLVGASLGLYTGGFVGGVGASLLAVGTVVSSEKSVLEGQGVYIKGWVA